MTFSDFAQLLTAAVLLGNFIMSILTMRKVEQVHVATNSITDRLVQSTATESHARGVKDEHDRANPKQ